MSVPSTGTFVTTSTTTIPLTSTDYGAWGYGAYSSGAAQVSTSCNITMSGTVTISQPVYIPGNLCMSGTANITQNASNNVTALRQRHALRLGELVRRHDDEEDLDRHGRSVQVRQLGLQLQRRERREPPHLREHVPEHRARDPEADDQPGRALPGGDPGPMHPCSVAAGSTAATTWPKFDTNTTRDGSLGTVGTGGGDSSVSSGSPKWSPWPQLWNSVNYICKSATGGEIDWNASTHTFTLHNSTVFFDGTLNFGGADYVLYSGKGNIYFNNTVTIGNGSYFCTTAACSNTGWNMANDIILLAAGNNGTVPTTCGYTFTFSGSGIYQGIAYANGCVSEGGSAQVEGPAVADGFNISGAATYFQPIGVNTLAPGAPATIVTTSTTTLATSTTTQTTTGQTVSNITNTTTTPIDFWGQLATSWRQLK